jgi:hypothetical protein
MSLTILWASVACYRDSFTFYHGGKYKDYILLGCDSMYCYIFEELAGSIFRLFPLKEALFLHWCKCVF